MPATISVADGRSVFRHAGWRPGRAQWGKAGPVGMSWCSLSSAVCWTHRHPIFIRFAAAAICLSSVINPGCYLAPPGHAVNTVLVCFSHVVPLQTFIQTAVETCYFHKCFCVFIFVVEDALDESDKQRSPWQRRKSFWGQVMIGTYIGATYVTATGELALKTCNFLKMTHSSFHLSPYA